MTKYSYQKNDSRFPSLFNAFNYEKNGFLSFHELLLGLASMEPNLKSCIYLFALEIQINSDKYRLSALLNAFRNMATNWVKKFGQN